MAKTLVIGDVHGCYQELEELIDKAKLSKKDHIISVGDLVNKGPSSVKTLDFVMKLKNFRAIVGNHEYSLLKHWRKNSFEEMTKDYQHKTIKEFGKKKEKYLEYLATFPYTIEEKDFLVIHGGLKPEKTLEEQDPIDLCYLSTLDAGTPWHDHYKDKKLILYGHWAQQGLHIKENSIGLDSGCVYGKELTGIILPARKIISVKAKKAYCPIS